ncbi:MAG: bifunctional 5,10-methylenetetrahydrofolate dehydrogenase/5,10-methenyltetrahydrofolate cyclohydrolase [Planctomycetes bacterium]|nr:bifunctional 5,10-methylenetetrahydrofolate dehydrogenase/5,10-methenyltetrahydrofolate cyclohydrolase [Planctomycetota bacterium]MCC8117060.1 bifunctional 5,10-methylenetetrahydrofolate dehydrogenase/5,10-methenyltetrahydrofolate cyclohydrolase [Planctomycetota bacterium]
MAATILDGTTETATVLAEVQANVAALARVGKKPCLAAVQANTDPGTDWYARAQAKHCAEQGVDHRHVVLPADSGTDAIATCLTSLSNDDSVSGIILLTPLPAGTEYIRIAEAINPVKDAEGINPQKLGELMIAGSVDPAPCTAMAALTLIKTARPNLAGARALVIGRSATVGKPLALLLLAEHATVTVAHTRSDLRQAMLDAEIVVAAAGASGARWRAYEKKWNEWRDQGGDRPAPPNLEPLVHVDMVRRGAVVVDVGDNNIPSGLDADGSPVKNAKGRADMRYSGDVDFDKVREVAGFITNPRGSVGPLTNAFLLRNVTRAALRLAGLPVAGSR